MKRVNILQDMEIKKLEFGSLFLREFQFFNFAKCYKQQKSGGTL